MQLSIDDYVSKLLEWDFTIVLGGKTYVTRPLTIGDILLVEGLKGIKDGIEVWRKLVALVDTMFVGEKPDIGRWDIETATFFITSLVDYFNEQTKKKNLTPASTDGAAGESDTTRLPN